MSPREAGVVRFIHTADIHLDSPLCGLERYEGAPVEEVRGATRRAFENLVQFALDEAVDLVLIAGDLYDGDWRDYNTGLFLVSQLRRLREAGIPTVLVTGNHDADSVITKRLRLPDGVVRLSSDRPQTVVFEESGLAVHGQGFSNRQVSCDLSLGYPAPIGGLCNIGLLHTSADGRPEHDVYAPCTLDGLRSRGYEYWALGHVHRREELARDPWIVFPGNLQGRHIREVGGKGASVVSVEDQAVVSVEHVDFDVLRWGVCRIDAAELDSAEAVVEEVASQVGRLSEQAAGRAVATRVIVEGQSRAHEELEADPDRWRNQVRAAVLDRTELAWVEKIVFGTRAAADLTQLMKDGHPLAQLLVELDRLSTDEVRLAALAPELADLAGKLPAEYLALPEGLDLRDPRTLARFVEPVRQLLMARLLAGEGE